VLAERERLAEERLARAETDCARSELRVALYRAQQVTRLLELGRRPPAELGRNERRAA
jgi:hypothetical protein